MSRERLEEIKGIHEKATEAYFREKEIGSCADGDIIIECLSELFNEEHTDWLIEQAERSLDYQEPSGTRMFSKKDTLKINNEILKQQNNAYRETQNKIKEILNSERPGHIKVFKIKELLEDEK